MCENPSRNSEAAVREARRRKILENSENRLKLIEGLKTCENPSRNSTAATGEARRRKILENSENRLKLIEGLNSSPRKSSSETFLEPKQEPETLNARTLNTYKNGSELNSKLSEFLNSNKELKEISDFLLNDNNDKVLGNETGDEKEGEEVKEEHAAVASLRENAFLNILVEKRLHYALLAVVVNLMLYLNIGYLFYENIFCPFYSVKIIEFLSRKEEKQTLPPVLFFLVVGLPTSVQKFTKVILSLLMVLLSDLSIYLFTFIIVMKIINQYH